MRTMRARTITASLLASVALVAGCDAGGFSGTAPEKSLGPVTFTNYVALGDGFASGPYLGRDVSGTGCLRSADNYPAQVARALKVGTVTDVTCVGATSEDLTTTATAPDSKKKLAAQLDAVTSSTDLVTLGIGIEDDGLLQDMFHICQAEPCGSDVLGPPVAKQLDAFGSSISSIVRTIQDVAPNATVVVVGYPQIMPQTGLCSALPAISDKQLEVAFGVLAQLNGFLRAAAFQTGSDYIDVAALSGDKTACSTQAWVNGWKTTKGKIQAFHPVAAEQKAVSDAIVAQVGVTTQ